MSSGEIIALLCVLCLVPLSFAGSIILFALGAIRCGRLMDPYYGGGGDGKREHCPLDPRGPRDDRGVQAPDDAGSEDSKPDWWPRFELELGRYVEEQESCPSRQGVLEIEPGSEARTRA